MHIFEEKWNIRHNTKYIIDIQYFLGIEKYLGTQSVAKLPPLKKTSYALCADYYSTGSSDI